MCDISTFYLKSFKPKSVFFAIFEISKMALLKSQDELGTRTCPAALRSSDQATLLRFLECPICREIAKPPIFTCQDNRHIFCGECRKFLFSQQCPSCKTLVTESRSVYIEQCMERVFLDCRFIEDGCQLSLKATEYRNHLTLCPFRPIQCFIPNCGQWIFFKEFFEHLKLDHKDKVNGIENLNQHIVEWWIEANSYSVAARWPPYYFTCFNNVFLYTSISTNHGMWEWASILADEEEASRFQVIANISSVDNTTEMRWKGPVHPIRRPINEIAESGLCFVINSKEMRNPFIFKKKDSPKHFWRTDVEIIQISPPTRRVTPYILTNEKPVKFKQKASVETTLIATGTSDQTIKNPNANDGMQKKTFEVVLMSNDYSFPSYNGGAAQDLPVIPENEEDPEKLTRSDFADSPLIVSPHFIPSLDIGNKSYPNPSPKRLSQPMPSRMPELDTLRANYPGKPEPFLSSDMVSNKLKEYISNSESRITTTYTTHRNLSILVPTGLSFNEVVIDGERRVSSGQNSYPNPEPKTLVPFTSRRNSPAKAPSGLIYEERRISRGPNSEPIPSSHRNSTGQAAGEFSFEEVEERRVSYGHNLVRNLDTTAPVTCRRNSSAQGLVSIDEDRKISVGKNLVPNFGTTYPSTSRRNYPDQSGQGLAPAPPDEDRRISVGQNLVLNSETTAPSASRRNSPAQRLAPLEEYRRVSTGQNFIPNPEATAPTAFRRNPPTQGLAPLDEDRRESLGHNIAPNSESQPKSTSVRTSLAQAQVDEDRKVSLGQNLVPNSQPGATANGTSRRIYHAQSVPQVDEKSRVSRDQNFPQNLEQKTSRRNFQAEGPQAISLNDADRPANEQIRGTNISTRDNKEFPLNADSCQPLKVSNENDDSTRRTSFFKISKLPDSRYNPGEGTS